MRWAFAGWIGAVLITLIFFIQTIHDVLAINEPVRANVLVVEGWAWYSAVMQEAAEEFYRGAYDLVIVVGTFSDASGHPQIHGNAVVSYPRFRRHRVKAHRRLRTAPD